MTTITNYPLDLPILVIEAQIFVAVKKFQFLPNKLIPNVGYQKSHRLIYFVMGDHCTPADGYDMFQY